MVSSLREAAKEKCAGVSGRQHGRHPALAEVISRDLPCALMRNPAGNERSSCASFTRRLERVAVIPTDA